MSTEINALIEQCLNVGIKEDVIFTKIAEHTGKGLINSIGVYRKFMKETGRVISNQQKREIIFNILNTAPKTEDGTLVDLTEAISAVQQKLDITPSAAFNAVKRVAIETNIKLPTRQRDTSINEVNAWLIANPNATKESFATWLISTGRKESMIAIYWSKFVFARHCFKTWAAA